MPREVRARSSQPRCSQRAAPLEDRDRPRGDFEDRTALQCVHRRAVRRQQRLAIRRRGVQAVLDATQLEFEAGRRGRADELGRIGLTGIDQLRSVPVDRVVLLRRGVVERGGDRTRRQQGEDLTNVLVPERLVQARNDRTTIRRMCIDDRGDRVDVGHSTALQQMIEGPNSNTASTFRPRFRTTVVVDLRLFAL